MPRAGFVFYGEGRALLLQIMLPKAVIRVSSVAIKRYPLFEGKKLFAGHR